MRAAGARVSHGKHDIARGLMLDVEVVLLDHALNEIAVHGLDSSSVIAGVHGCAVNGASWDGGRRGSASREKKTIGKAAAGLAERRTNSGWEGVHFGVERRILPQPLSALIPCGIVKDGVSGAYRRLWAQRRPSYS